MTDAPPGRSDDDEPILLIPSWPLLVSEDTKRHLLESLAEMVHAPDKGDFARGYETGMAFVMLQLGINEAGSPERKSLPPPAG